MFKKMLKIMAPLITIASLAVACKSVPVFTDVVDKDWILAEIQNGTASITINRDSLKDAGLSDIFTLRFDMDTVNGVGAPNRYFSPYVLGEKQNITINTLAGTLMAPIRELNELKEQTYFAILQNVYKWNISGRNLELFSTGENGAETMLVYTPAKGR